MPSSAWFPRAVHPDRRRDRADRPDRRLGAERSLHTGEPLARAGPAGRPRGGKSFGAPVPQPEARRDIRKCLTESGLDPRLLELELTESLLMHDAEQAAEMLNELKSMA